MGGRTFLVAMLLVGTSWGCGAASPTTGSVALDSEVARGEALFERYCALCHGDSGDGYAADNATALNTPELLTTATDEFLRAAILRGRPGTPMSAFGRQYGGPLDRSEADAITAFVRTWQTEPTVDVHDREVGGRAERGAAVYADECAQCHGPRGEGGEAASLDNPVFHDTASDGYIRYAIEHGRSGTPMPAFGDSLSGGTIDDLVAFVRSLRRADERRPDRRAAASTEVVIHPDGPAPDFTLREGMYVPADQVQSALDSGARMVIVDARAKSDYLQVHIPGAISMPYYRVDDEAERLPRDTWIVAYCACPHAASGRVVRALRERGFEHTAVLDEGLPVWIERGYPITEASD